ncbi:MAG: NAD(P)-dependent oxidoreductase [Woeseiaceae bacterium]|nr:NAD(P)-dependent oxidoreductase [Woeseiaceae bacterium]
MTFDHIITGAAGFVGGHLCRHPDVDSEKSKTALLDLLPIDFASRESSITDIRSLADLNRLAQRWAAPTLIHLAALAEVVMPFTMMRELVDTNVVGTINVLDCFRPERAVFASSSAVYGSRGDRPALPQLDDCSAAGTYGASKVMGELVCASWAAENESRSVILRFGNIVGPGCRGLIPYLVDHGVKNPEGELAAQLRGNGRIVRDYLPVEYAIDSIMNAAALPLDAGQAVVFNVGSGRGISNREVAEFVAEIMRNRGFRMNLDFDNPLPFGESDSVVLEVSDTRERLDVAIPSLNDIYASIEQSTLWHLEHQLSRNASGANA